MTEAELRKAFDRFTPKSDWERLFANKVKGIDIESLIETVRCNRNDITHCKYCYSQQYILFNKAACELNRAITKAIKVTEEKDFVVKNTEGIGIDMARLAKAFSGFQFQIRDPLVDFLGVLQASLQPIIETLNKYSIGRTYAKAEMKNLQKEENNNANNSLRGKN